VPPPAYNWDALLHISPPEVVPETESVPKSEHPSSHCLLQCPTGPKSIRSGGAVDSPMRPEYPARCLSEETPV